MKYNRILPLLIPFMIFLLFEVFFFYPKMIFVALVLSNLLVLFTSRQFMLKSELKGRWWNFFFLPALFLTSLAAYTTIMTSRIAIHTLFAANAVFLYFYLKSAYYYLVNPSQYKSFTLPNIASYGTFLAMFFVSAAIYGFQTFLNMPIWSLMFPILFAASLAAYQVLWTNGVELKDALIYILVCSLILVELSWSISFLPLNFNVAGLILAICYYILIGLIRFYLLEKLDKKIIRLYLMLGFASIFILLLTARWL